MKFLIIIIFLSLITCSNDDKDEKKCELTVEGIEICDGIDNDCDGIIDNGNNLCNLDNAESICEEGICKISQCDPEWIDSDRDSKNGCEKPRACIEISGVEFDQYAPWFEQPNNISLDATKMEIFNSDYHYFTGDNDMRTITKMISLPQLNCWKQVALQLKLECPDDGLCDHWDRFANISLIDKDGEEIEILRYITPYKLEMYKFVDITHLTSKLQGDITFKSFIGTWVGPDSNYGTGWNLSVTLYFYPGENNYPDEIVNIYPHTDLYIGDPDNLIIDQMLPKSIYIPEDATKIEVRYIGTGHGQGNKFSCAEFCQLKQIINVNETIYQISPWRSDCSENPINNQLGTWEYPRQGWCPGAVVNPYIIDITDSIIKGENNQISIDIKSPNGSEYINSCRPGGGNGDPEICEGCTWGDNICDYNSTGHTPPFQAISMQIMIYK